MKTRIGFVSNSSSTSFILAGFYLNNVEEVEDFFKKLFGKPFSEMDEYDENEDIMDSICELLDNEDITKILKSKGYTSEFEIFRDWDDGDVLVGFGYRFGEHKQIPFDDIKRMQEDILKLVDELDIKNKRPELIFTTYHD